MTDASRKAKERASRKAKGEKRVEVWLGPNELKRIDDYAAEMGKTRQQAIIEFIRFCP